MTLNQSLLIAESEVMEILLISSRQTIWNYINHYGFPKPIRTRPKAYLREDVERWIRNGGVNQK